MRLRCYFWSIYYISLVGCCTKLDIYIFLFSILRSFFRAAFFLKTMIFVIFTKILYCDFIPTIYKNFKSVCFYLYRTNENLELCMSVLFEQLSKSLSLDNVLKNGYSLKKTKYHVCWKLQYVSICSFCTTTIPQWNKY